MSEFRAQCLPAVPVKLSLGLKVYRQFLKVYRQRVLGSRFTGSLAEGVLLRREELPALESRPNAPDHQSELFGPFRGSTKVNYLDHFEELFGPFRGFPMRLTTKVNYLDHPEVNYLDHFETRVIPYGLKSETSVCRAIHHSETGFDSSLHLVGGSTPSVPDNGQQRVQYDHRGERPFALSRGLRGFGGRREHVASGGGAVLGTL